MGQTDVLLLRGAEIERKRENNTTTTVAPASSKLFFRTAWLSERERKREKWRGKSSLSLAGEGEAGRKLVAAVWQCGTSVAR